MYWTDKQLIEFAKISSKGSYGRFKECKTVKQKLNKFKQLQLNKLKTKQHENPDNFADFFLHC